MLTAVCMVALLFVVALVVNVGIAYTEKSQLQNGADAAALAVAQTCAKRTATSPCQAGVVDAGLQTMANSMVNGNSNDGTSAVSLAMGSGTVTATVSTVSSDGNKIVLPISGVDATVRAEAAAVWGGVRSGKPILPITFGGCELDPTTHPMNGVDRVLIAHGDLPGGGKCSAWNSSSGLNMPGGFGWLITGSDCTPTVTVDNPYAQSSTGASVPSGCKSIINVSLVGTEVLLPIFGYADGTGANGKYKIIGWGVFVLKGWNLPSNDVNPYNWTASHSVKGLYGHFIRKLTYEEGFTFGGPSEFGATGVSLSK